MVLTDVGLTIEQGDMNLVDGRIGINVENAEYMLDVQAFSEIGDQFGFFLPAVGKDRYRPAEENPVDVKATGKLAKLYDALVKANRGWATDARRHDMSQVMTRLHFCMFAEDVGIFPENQFSRAIITHAGDKGETLAPPRIERSCICSVARMV